MGYLPPKPPPLRPQIERNGRMITDDSFVPTKEIVRIQTVCAYCGRVHEGKAVNCISCGSPPK